MDIAAQAPATDDQELAKVLESMNNNLTTAPAAPVAAPDEPANTSPADDGMQFDTPAPQAVPAPPVATPAVAPTAPSSAVTTALSSDLEAIKKEAVTELRPLVDKLNLAPQDRFDTLLLIIRSTDDQSLVPQVHEAAKAIEDDTRRAEALLDVIKEIDFFAHPQS